MATPVVTKTAWKLQEIVAHASNVSSLVLGKGSGRLLATGGDDCRVNLWSINKPNCIMLSAQEGPGQPQMAATVARPREWGVTWLWTARLGACERLNEWSLPCPAQGPSTHRQLCVG